MIKYKSKYMEKLQEKIFKEKEKNSLLLKPISELTIEELVSLNIGVSINRVFRD
jgi:hypothetical protein